MTQDAETVALLERAKMILGVVTVASSARAKMTQDTEAQAEQIFLVGFSSFCQ
jgi:hypothetical protein